MIGLKTYLRKADLLKDLGKKSDDTRYIDRAIERWEIIHLNIDWVDRLAIYKDVERFFIGVLVWEIGTLSAIPDSSGELEEAKANIEYYEKENEELRDKNIALESVLDSLREKGIEISRGC